MSLRVLAVSTGRADFHLMLPVWSRLASEPGVRLDILLTGAHTRAAPEAPAELAGRAGWHVAGASLDGGDAAQAAGALARVGDAAVALYRSIGPDLILAIGDRIEMFAAVAASVPFNIPVAHLHGGELSYGAIDDRLRHAISKLAHLHFAATAQAAERLARMGEETWRISITGAPGLDALIAAPDVDDEEFLRETGLVRARGFRLATVHPETNSDQPEAPLTALLRAIESDSVPTLFTAPNDDMGSRLLLDRITAFVAAHPWARFHAGLGTRLYAAALRRAALMLGNSSSGIIEAGLFGLPVIDIGTRQKGRDRGSNVVSCAADPVAIQAAIRRAPAQRFSAAEVSVYGDGKAAARIVEALRAPPPRTQLLMKQFASSAAVFQAPWTNVARRQAQ